MKRFITLVLCCVVWLFSACSYKENNSVNDNSQIVPPSVDESVIIPPVESLPNNPPNEIIPPFDDEEIEKKKYLVSKTNSLRIRSGPSSNYSVVGYMDKNDMVLYIEKQGSYYKTIYKEKFAYVHADYVDLFEIESYTNEVEKAIEFGMKLLGYPYVWGSERYHWGNGKLNSNFVNGKFDCSAFVQYVYYKTNGVLLDVTSRAQSLNGEFVEKSQLKRGDLMFFTNASRYNKKGVERIGHVGIYFGNNYILHTASDYAVLEPISNLRWSYYLTSRRVV
ncbi:MAG: NlpC/P60 family protein [Clostridiales bacterium]|nr:NlpC/P60 family protein [Clostridiales bacterium]